MKMVNGRLTEMRRINFLGNVLIAEVFKFDVRVSESPCAYNPRDQLNMARDAKTTPPRGGQKRLASASPEALTSLLLIRRGLFHRGADRQRIEGRAELTAVACRGRQRLPHIEGELGGNLQMRGA